MRRPPLPPRRSRPSSRPMAATSLCVEPCPAGMAHQYGIVALEGQSAGPLNRMTGMVEKPAPGTEPSNLVHLWSLRARFRHLQSAGRRGARRRRRNPAHRRHGQADGGAALLRFGIRWCDLRLRVTRSAGFAPTWPWRLKRPDLADAARRGPRAAILAALPCENGGSLVFAPALKVVQVSRLPKGMGERACRPAIDALGIWSGRGRSTPAIRALLPMTPPLPSLRPRRGLGRTRLRGPRRRANARILPAWPRPLPAAQPTSSSSW